MNKEILRENIKERIQSIILHELVQNEKRKLLTQQNQSLETTN